ncbi:hypothetical protein GCM10022247_74100 [Allokutzneria multivorans]|uniref:HTH marR-type domain-containing protein n=1 Tax=Allokutzneria multivorans TaxID=1142134 RepID=A0ABP7U7Q4_9PSEU
MPASSASREPAVLLDPENGAWSCVGRELTVVARAIRCHLDRLLAARGLTFAGFLALQELGAGARGNSELAARLEIEAPTLTRQINKLVATGLVERIVPENNRRCVRLSLTRKGRALLTTLRQEVADADAEVRSCLAEEELITLRALLGRLGARLEELEVPGRQRDEGWCASSSVRS